MNWFDTVLGLGIGVVVGFFARVAYNWFTASTKTPPPSPPMGK